jgi:hypothetical protein
MRRIDFFQLLRQLPNVEAFNDTTDDCVDFVYVGDNASGAHRMVIRWIKDGYYTLEGNPPVVGWSQSLVCDTVTKVDPHFYDTDAIAALIAPARHSYSSVEIGIVDVSFPLLGEYTTHSLRRALNLMAESLDKLDIFANALASR